jgi:phage baseplate assembly protein W
MAAINFNSVGIRQSEITTSENSSTVVYYGIKTPLRKGENSEGLFAMNTSLSDQIRDNFFNLLKTNHGERLGNYDFGANLQPLVAERNVQEEFDSEAAVRIKTATSKFMSYITLNTFESFVSHPLRGDPSEIDSVRIRISYDVVVPGVISDRGKIVEVTFYTL